MIDAHRSHVHLSDGLEAQPHVTREFVYETDATTNRAQRRAGHKQGVFVPKSSNRPAVKQKDGSYAPQEDQA